jgi:hypothetical protein
MLLRIPLSGVLVFLFAVPVETAVQETCAGRPMVVGGVALTVLDRGGIVTRAKLNINIDGSGRAYNWDNAKGLIHLCNAARVFLPDGTSYEGSASTQTCTTRFMADLARVKAAGWTDGSVGAVQWYGVAATGTSVVKGRMIRGVIPAEIPDSGGFLVSPTTLADPSFPATDQRRYVDPLTIPSAVIPSNGALKQFGVVPGTFGAAWRSRTGIAVPFVVSDAGPRVGEGSPALARRLAGLAPKADLTRQERFVGQVDTPDVTWVFFGGQPMSPPYTADAVNTAAQAAFDAWGGQTRIRSCSPARP